MAVARQRLSQRPPMAPYQVLRVAAVGMTRSGKMQDRAPSLYDARAHIALVPFATYTRDCRSRGDLLEREIRDVRGRHLRFRLARLPPPEPTVQTRQPCNTNPRTVWPLAHMVGRAVSH
jgi:hypothetical protein